MLKPRSAVKGKKQKPYYKYEGSKTCDIIIVFMDDVPYCIVPHSERAKNLFINHWGMEAESTGIVPPISVDDLAYSIPENWTMRKGQYKFGTHVVQEITLPREIPVLH